MTVTRRLRGRTCSEVLWSRYWCVRSRDTGGGQADVEVPTLHAEEGLKMTRWRRGEEEEQEEKEEEELMSARKYNKRKKRVTANLQSRRCLSAGGRRRARALQCAHPALRHEIPTRDAPARGRGSRRGHDGGGQREGGGGRLHKRPDDDFGAQGLYGYPTVVSEAHVSIAVA